MKEYVIAWSDLISTAATAGEQGPGSRAGASPPSRPERLSEMNVYTVGVGCLILSKMPCERLSIMTQVNQV